MSDGIELTDDEYDTFMAVLAEQYEQCVWCRWTRGIEGQREWGFLLENQPSRNSMSSSKVRKAIANGAGVLGYHHYTTCPEGEPCPAHRLTNHPLRDWQQVVKDEKFFRVCPHGLLHPDPDDREGLMALKSDNEEMPRHECDGCCRDVWQR